MATKAIKICAVNFMKSYLDSLVADGSKIIEAFNKRPIQGKLALVTGRLVDSHEEMLNKWREKGVNGALSPLPVFLMGFDKSYASTGLEKGRSVAMQNFIVRDNADNYFKVRVSKHDQRVQVVLYCPDHETAFSFANQFKLFCADYKNRHHFAISEYNGVAYPFAMTLEDNNVFAPSSQIADQDNLSVLVFDLTFNCNTPYFSGDVSGEPYLPTVNTVIFDNQTYEQQKTVYHQVIKAEED